MQEPGTNPKTSLDKSILFAKPTKEDIVQVEKSRLNLITDTELQKSGILWVVMDKHRSTVLKSPGLSSPFSTKVRKYAEQVAKSYGGVVEPLRMAIKHVGNSCCNLPPEHPYYDSDPRKKLKN